MNSKKRFLYPFSLLLALSISGCGFMGGSNSKVDPSDNPSTSLTSTSTSSKSSSSSSKTSTTIKPISNIYYINESTLSNGTYDSTAD